MGFIQLLGLSLGTFFIINLLVSKNNFLLDNKKSSFHKVFIDNKSNPPFIGGIFILFSLFFLLPNSEVNLKIFIFLIFMIGLSSDIGIIKSANLRFVIQIIVVLFSVTILDQYIQSIKWGLFDDLLVNDYFKIFFIYFNN